MHPAAAAAAAACMAHASWEPGCDQADADGEPNLYHELFGSSDDDTDEVCPQPCSSQRTPTWMYKPIQELPGPGMIERP